MRALRLGARIPKMGQNCTVIGAILGFSEKISVGSGTKALLGYYYSCSLLQVAGLARAGRHEISSKSGFKS